MKLNYRSRENNIIPLYARKYLSIPLTLFLLTSILPAQTPGTGAIVGTVRDPSGLVVVGAAVSAVNEIDGPGPDGDNKLDGGIYDAAALARKLLDHGELIGICGQLSAFGTCSGRRVEFG